jgi:hypothetical protein
MQFRIVSNWVASNVLGPYLDDMGAHHHAEYPWRATARVAPGSWVYRDDDPWRGDVALLVLDEPVPCDARATLWRAPISGGRVRALGYLPGITRYVAGEPADRLGDMDDPLPELAHSGALATALTRELARLLASGWAGTVVLCGGDSTGTAWLVRLVRTADPATRAKASDAKLAKTPKDMVLGLGTIDAAYDARGKSAAAVIRYLVEHSGCRPGTSRRSVSCYGGSRRLFTQAVLEYVNDSSEQNLTNLLGGLQQTQQSAGAGPSPVWNSACSGGGASLRGILWTR